MNVQTYLKPPKPKTAPMPRQEPRPGNDLDRLCFSRSGKVAHMQHKNGPTGCLRCGAAYPERESSL